MRGGMRYGVRHSWASMLNAEPERQEVDYRCRICDDAVMVGYGTETGLEIQSCRDCEDKRIRQLVAAEKELAQMKRDQKRDWLKVASLAQLKVGELEA